MYIILIIYVSVCIYERIEPFVHVFANNDYVCYIFILELVYRVTHLANLLTHLYAPFYE